MAAEHEGDGLWRRVGLVVGWVWVVFAVALFVVAIVGLPSGGTPAHTTEPATTGTSGIISGRNTAAVRRFIEFAGQTGQASGTVVPMGLDHRYTADGLRRLADALTAINDDARADQSAAVLREAASEITQNPRSLAHADAVRRAFDAAAVDLGALDPDRASATREAARAVDPSRPLLDQQSAVHAFFSEAARAVSEVALERSRAGGQRRVG